MSIDILSLVPAPAPSPIPAYLTGRPPALAIGMPAEITHGDHAGLCGYVREITIRTAGRDEWVLIQLQDGSWVQVPRDHVSPAQHK